MTKHFRLATALTFAGIAFVACNPFQRQAARSVLDAANVACLLANAALSDADVAKVCRLVDGLDDPLRRLLATQREQVKAAEGRGRLAGSVGCYLERSDAGASDGGIQ